MILLFCDHYYQIGVNDKYWGMANLKYDYTLLRKDFIK